ncbi:hypothetical protein cand_028930 [Cryptosporidium andersoni]|uniref:Uncharacterized protein n=1 Tax=Cryptosporidium andersoni TaxID=117008 RepID=A0A1J4MNW2_9CRYT|nr:hypothetical protein cand_028930 [Cryptosporidium andersoni]
MANNDDNDIFKENPNFDNNCLDPEDITETSFSPVSINGNNTFNTSTSITTHLSSSHADNSAIQPSYNLNKLQTGSIIDVKESTYSPIDKSQYSLPSYSTVNNNQSEYHNPPQLYRSFNDLNGSSISGSLEAIERESQKRSASCYDSPILDNSSTIYLDKTKKNLHNQQYRHYTQQQLEGVDDILASQHYQPYQQHSQHNQPNPINQSDLKSKYNQNSQIEFSNFYK